MQKINIDQVKELDNSIANLFDIKTNSEPLAQKGWSCISYPTQNKLVKYAVPTAYEFLKDKLDNADATIEGWQNLYFNNGVRSFVIDDNVLIFKNDNYGFSPVKCKIGEVNDSSKWISINFPITAPSGYGYGYDYNGATILLITDKVICFGVGENQRKYIAIIDKNSFETIKIIKISDNYGDLRYISLVNNHIFFSVNNNTYKFLNTNIADDIVLETVKSGLDIRLVFKFDGTYYYYVYRQGGYPASWIIQKTTDFNTITTIGYLSAFGPDAYKCMFTYDDNGNIYNFLQTNTIRKSKNIETWSGYRTEVWENTTLDFTNYGSAYTNASEIQFIFKNQIGFVIAYNLQDGGASIIYSNDLKNFQFIYKTSFSFSSSISCDTNGQYANYNYNRNLYFSQPHAVPIIYTDTINGIDIKYYKNGDWKMCTPDIAVGNDDNLQDVFEYLGYLNYWWIDTTNEQITLQRNSNMWTMMYVGDDYIDSSLPNGNYYAYATKNDIPNVNIYKEKAQTIEIDTASVTIDNVLANKNYVFTNNAITDITLTACETSMEETTIQFTTGSSAPTLTDNSGLVWFDGIPTLQANTTYVIVIFNKQAFYQEN